MWKVDRLSTVKTPLGWEARIEARGRSYSVGDNYPTKRAAEQAAEQICQEKNLLIEIAGGGADE